MPPRRSRSGGPTPQRQFHGDALRPVWEDEFAAMEVHDRVPRPNPATGQPGHLSVQVIDSKEAVVQAECRKVADPGIGQSLLAPLPQQLQLQSWRSLWKEQNCNETTARYRAWDAMGSAAPASTTVMDRHCTRRLRRGHHSWKPCPPMARGPE